MIVAGVKTVSGCPTLAGAIAREKLAGETPRQILFPRCKECPRSIGWIKV
jgi:hypothetical protein